MHAVAVSVTEWSGRWKPSEAYAAGFPGLGQECFCPVLLSPVSHPEIDGVQKPPIREQDDPCYSIRLKKHGRGLIGMDRPSCGDESSGRASPQTLETGTVSKAERRALVTSVRL